MHHHSVTGQRFNPAGRLALVAAIAAAMLTGPSKADAFDIVGYETCASRIDAVSSFWRDLHVRDMSCTAGAKVARAWVRRYARKTVPDFPARTSVLHYRCTFKMLQGEYNPYGRVTCTRGARTLRFYGFS